MTIENLIPVGRNNAITREQLCIRLGISDRKVRRYIEETRENVAIVNLSDGKGYFIPDTNDNIDMFLLRSYIRQEISRINKINNSIQKAKEVALKGDK